MLRFILKVAFRNMLRQRRRSFLTFFLIFIAYLLISVSLSLGEGSYNLIIENFTSNFIGHVRIQKKGYEENPSTYSVIENHKELGKILEKEKSIKSFTPRILGSALAYGANKTGPSQIIGIDLKKERDTTTFLKDIPKDFSFKPIEDVSPVVISKTLQKKLKLKLGEEVILIGSAYDGSIANDRFFVGSILEHEEIVGPWTILMSLEKASEFFALEGRVHQIIITEKKFNTASLIKASLEDTLKERKEFEILKWEEVAKEFYTSMETDKQGNNISIMIIMLMAVMTVLNTILMAVLERIPEFGLLRALGTKSSVVISAVFMEVFFLASFACSFGVVIGAGINYWFEKVGIEFPTTFEVGGMVFNRMTGEVSLYTLGFPFLIILASSLLATIYPAYKAISEDPVTALRSR